MLSAGICLLISIVFIAETIMAGKAEPSVKTHKITEGIRKILLFVPAMAVLIFTVLFCTVLKGRLVERSSHALIVLCLWLYGTTFYVNILKFFKNRIVLVISIIGMILSVALAIFLTPLDRYCEVMFASIRAFAYILGGVMLVLWYFVMLKNRR